MEGDLNPGGGTRHVIMRKTTYPHGADLFRIFIVGPTVAVLTALVSFVYIGCRLWRPFRRTVPTDASGWRRFARKGEDLVRREAGSFAEEARAAADSLTSAARSAWIFCLETVSGAAVGVLLALLVRPDTSPEGGHLLLGATLGAAVGALAALAHLRSGRRS